MKKAVSTFLVVGLVLISGAFTMASAQTTAATPAGVDVTGPWSGTFAYQNQALGAGTAFAKFQQDGQKLSGSLTTYGPGGQEYGVVGFVYGNQIKLSQPTFGTLTVNGNEMSGVLDAWDNAKITLRRQ